MNMHIRMKDDCLAMLLLLASMLVSDAGGLFISQEMAITKLKNETFFVTCRDEGGSPVTWRGPKGILGPKTRPMVQMGSVGTSIIFNGAVIEDSGTYTCSTKSGEQKEFHLSIIAPLTFMDTSTTQVGIEGKPFTLRCEVQGGKVTWSVEGGDLSDKEKFVVGGDGLLITKLNRSDSKTYICKAVQQSTGTVQDRKIKLRVLHKPTFPHQRYAKQEIVPGYINGTVNLTCIIMADPPANFTWMRSRDRKQIIANIVNESPQVSILQLHVDKSTFGDYKCIADNKYGKLEKHFSLEEVVRPKPPEIIAEKQIHSNFLKLEIQEGNTTVQPGIERKGYRVQYKRKEDASWENRDFNITKDNYYRLDNLTSETEYEIRVATKNAAGLSEFSKISLFKTLEPQPDSALFNSPSMCSVVAVTTTILFQMYDLAFW